MHTRQSPWNIWEAVLLLDAFLSTLDGTKNRAEAIRQVSANLRTMAIHKGIQIDDIYRNENGISFQMDSMESAYCGYTIFKHATKLFTETVRLYHQEPEEYQKLLQEANAMVENAISVKEDFMQYLADKVTPSQLSDMCTYYAEIETFCLKIHVLQKPLFETTDVETIKNVKNTIEHNKTFRISNWQNIQKKKDAIWLYFAYILQRGSTVSPKNTGAAPAKTPTSQVVHKSPATKDTSLVTIDFNHVYNLTDTHPITLLYFENPIPFSEGWTGLYLQFVSILCKDYPRIMVPGLTFSKIHPLNEFNSVRYSTGMLSPRRVPGTSFMIETLLSPNEMVARIRYLIELCNIDFENIIIRYWKLPATNAVTTETKPKPALQPTSRPTPEHTKEKPAVSPPPPAAPTKLTKNDTTIEAVLRQYFTKGFMLDSTLTLGRFKKYYAEMYSEEPSCTDEAILETVKKLCIVNDKMAYLPETLLDEEQKKALFAYIQNAFAKGATALYYDALYAALSDILIDSRIYDASMLARYLLHEQNGSYFLRDSYMVKTRSDKPDLPAEIRTYMETEARPLTIEEVVTALPHLPESEIRRILVQERDIISNGNSTYFLTELVYISDNEWAGIEKLLRNAIATFRYISITDFANAVKKQYPNIFEDHPFLTTQGFRNLAKNKLCANFYFSTNSIAAARQ